MTLIDYSVVGWITLGFHAFLLIKTDYFNGRLEPFGVLHRRGPHYKPMPDKK